MLPPPLVPPGRTQDKGPGLLVATQGPAQLFGHLSHARKLRGHGAASGLPMFCWAMSGASAPAGCFGSCGHMKKAFSSHHIALRAAEPCSPLSSPPSQALSTSLQGFLHSLAYGWLRQNFRREAVGPRPSLQHPRGLQGFYDESLGALP